jgi:hypothetical protein
MSGRERHWRGLGRRASGSWRLPPADPDSWRNTVRADARAIRSHRAFWGLAVLLAAVATVSLAYSTLHGVAKFVVVLISSYVGAVVLVWACSWVFPAAFARRRQLAAALGQRDQAQETISQMMEGTRELQQERSELRNRVAVLTNELNELRPDLEMAHAKLEAKPIDDVAPLFGTELRDIRTKIERVKATNPPSYPPVFQLPGACFTKYGPVLAERRKDLYAIVERAYAAAHHVNENVRTRQVRAGAHMLLGAISEDGLDEAHGLAGEALDALQQAHNEPVESSLRRAAREVLEDMTGDDR